MGKLVSIVIFVHNEEEALPNFLRELANQRLSLDHYRFNLFFACNGCNDNSVKLCEEASDNFADLFESYIVYDWSEPSKSMAWNRSVRLLQEQNSPDFIVFMDSDISIESATCIEDLLREFSDDKCQIVTSKPVKQFSSSTPWFLKVASKIVGNKHQDGAVCGQLYAARASAVHDLYLPVPCLVEDGFIAATMVTNYFTENPDPSYVRASKRAWHFFEPPTGLLDFFNHDVRLELGTEMNAAFYTPLWAAQDRKGCIRLCKDILSQSQHEKYLSEHEACPSKAALQYKKLTQNILKKINGNKFPRNILLLPLWLANAVYKMLVYNKAKRLFRQRIFRW